MSLVRAIISVGLVILASCSTVQNSLYQSKAPEIRGERAIASSIDLVREVNIGAKPRDWPVVIGVFYSKEVYGGGETQAVLFALRQETTGALGFARKAEGTINDYDLRETSSLSLNQARRFLDALNNYLTTDPKSLAPERMLNFELYSGTLDTREGTESYRPFRELTFIVVFSVTNAKKTFRTVFPTSVVGPYNTRQTVYRTYDLTEDEVTELRDAIDAAVGKATPEVAPTDSKNPA